MSETANSVLVAAEWLQLSEVSLSSWVPILGLLLGGGLFVLWQRHAASLWGAQPDITVVPTYRSTLPRLGLELARMRRYERSLAVMVLHLEAQPGGQRKERRKAFRNGAFAYWHVATMLRDLLRNSDIVTSDPSAERFVILLPEANRNQALLAAHRLQTPILAAAQMQVRMGVAEFPADGLILEELVKVAEAECASPEKSAEGLAVQLES